MIKESNYYYYCDAHCTEKLEEMVVALKIECGLHGAQNIT